jgi:hypothetical protein
MARQDLIFGGIAFLLALPSLVFDYFPTHDGPVHLYNAQILHDRVLGGPLAAREYLSWNPVPIPNYLTHATLATALSLLSPPWAEKFLLTGYFLLFAAAFRYAARHAGGAESNAQFLVLPFLHNIHIYWGFYNFCFALPLFLFAMGYWLERRRDWRWRHALCWSGILTLTYFCHLIALAETALAVAAFLFIDWMRAQDKWAVFRRGFVFAAAFVPAASLYIYYSLFRLHGSESVVEWPSWRYALANLIRLEPLAAFHPAERIVSTTLAAALLSISYFVWRARADRPAPATAAWALFAGLAAGAVLFAPVTFSSGTMLTPRFVYFACFGLLLWLASAGIPPRLNKALPAIGVGFALVFLVLRVPVYASYSARANALMESLPDVAPGAIVYSNSYTRRPLLDSSPSALGIPLSPFFGSYWALRESLIELNNYEAQTDHFPFVFERGKNPYPALEAGGRIHPDAVSNLRYILLHGPKTPAPGGLPSLSVDTRAPDSSRCVVLRKADSLAAFELHETISCHPLTSPKPDIRN